MDVVYLSAKRSAARASAAEAVEDAESPLERRAGKAEGELAAGADAVRFELSRLNQLIELLSKPPQIRRPHLSRPRSQAALKVEPPRRENRERDSAGGPEQSEALPCQRLERQRSALRAALDGDVHRLHDLLRRLCAESDGLPAACSSAPGYYAVYFTDDGSGIAVEYVHLPEPGGGS
ncbi:MAG: hypothetical protein R3337_08220 [Gammaproteobacteria bacterium]|nr:hypothetical protein [Gammaproteobacteria bacterium]